MLEEATVIDIKNDIITLACSDTEGCKSCAASGLCTAGQKTFEAHNSRNLDLEPGSRVEVELPTGKTIGSAFMVMIFPLLLFFLFFFISGKILTNPAEGIQVLFGLAGIAAGFGITFITGKLSGKKAMPEITGKFD